MILTGPTPCLPSAATVQELFSVARDASVIPNISLDPVLTTFLSLDSSAALQHQFAFLQRGMSNQQQMEFTLNLTAEVGGTRVTRGGVGVVALALSLLLEQVAQQVRFPHPTYLNLTSQRPESTNIFGISTSSRIGSIISAYLNLLPGIANDEERMAEVTELYDNVLKLELLDHYERMTTKKRMSSVSMQQWLTGAAVHLHMRIHQIRLHSVPSGSAHSLRLSYKTGWNRLVQGYTSYLHRNVQETGAPEPNRHPSQLSNVSFFTNTTSTTSLVSDFSPSVNSSQGFLLNSTTTCCESGATKTTKEVIDSSGVKTNTIPHNVIDHSKVIENGSKLGMLVIEPLRNISHNVHHHPCQSAAIQQALVTRIINSQDVERSRNFFLYPEKVFLRLIRQSSDFKLASV